MSNVTQQPLVSIITPCYNGEKFLDRYFESILKQTYENMELIFINDGSTDGTERLALSYQKKLENRGITFIYIFQENAGQAAAINKGLKIFRGEYLTWPDADDFMHPECIEKKVKYLEQNDLAVILCKTAVVSDNDPARVLYFLERKGLGTYLFEDLILENDIYYAPGGYMVRSKEFLEMLPEREIYAGRCGQNWQLLLPICYKYHCGISDECLYYYCLRADSHSHQHYNYERQLNHYQEQEKTLIETIKRIKMERDEHDRYFILIKKKYAKKRFEFAVHSRKKNDVKKEYNERKNYENLDFKDKWMYLCGRSNFFYFIYKMIRKMKHFVGRGC